MKILRLSLFNIKKHKKESFVIIFLIMISMALLGIGIINIEKADRMFDEMYEKTGSYNNLLMFPENSYKNEYGEIVENDERVTETFVFDSLQFDTSTSVSYRKDDGSTAQFQALFISEGDESKLEKFEKKTSLSDEKIEGFEHPIWVPYYLKYNLGFSEGDDLILIIGGKDYTFQIAGFYESGLVAGYSNGIKCVLTERDFDMMSAVVPEHKMIAFNTKDGAANSNDDIEKLVNDLQKKFEDISGKSLFLYFYDYYTEKLASTSVIDILMAIIAFVSLVTAVSCIFMIRHKITNDIEDQMESIGVLEALGYRSGEISGAYIYEYLLLGMIGVIIGGVLLIAIDLPMTRLLKAFLGHDNVVSGNVILAIIPATLLILLILITALLKARRIKKYPPVVAFRKGIRTHHFGKNVFPLNKTRSDINSRLGLKGLFSSSRQNVGLFVCILAATLVITFCIYLADIFRDRGAVFLNISGVEKALMIGFDKGTDFDSVMQEISEREDVRKCVLLRINNGFSINGYDFDTFQTFAYENYDELENLYISEGRFPIHENEIMIGTGMAEKYNLSVGDSLLLKYNNIEKSFIISGTTNIFTNSGMDGYLTLDGFEQFMSPSECANYLFVYAADGVSEAELKDRLTAEYGSVEDTVGKSQDEGSLEDRIKAKADEQMALLKSKYGVSNASYAIKVGDKIITGDSGKFQLTEISSFSETMDTQMGGLSVVSQIFSMIIMIIVVGVISIIMNFLIESIIKKERQAMGIEKAMGYTSKDIRKQIVVRMMPVAIPAIIAGATLTIPIVRSFLKLAFGTAFDIRLFWVPIAVVLISLYVYVSTYISAGKVKKVSVTELMTE